MRANGFTVEEEGVASLDAVKVEHGVPQELRTCHTAIVDGYVVEGHVPAEDVERLLAERPEIAGVAVAGMPAGSPGMEVAGQPAEPFDVVAFTADGDTSVFASH
jgi:hypothetical protein